MRILYLDLDSLTPSHLSCYGYRRRTSPTIDAIAAEGVRLTGAYCSDAPCLPSRTAFYSGRFGIQTGVVGHGGTAADPKCEGPRRGFADRFNAGLAGQLQRLGFHTAMVSPFGQRHSAHHFYAGFKEIHNTGRGGMESAEEVQPTVRRWLGAHAAEDSWYLHINYWDIHTPYRAPKDYPNPFADEPVDAWLADPALLERHRRKTGPHSLQDLSMYDDRADPRHPRHLGRIDTAADLKRWIDGYDTAIRYVDDQIREIVGMLKAAGVYEDTAIIISADHGENQGELGIYGEHGTADHGTCNIPMIIKWPGGARGAVNAGLQYGLDVAPTLMELLGGSIPEFWDGQSFASVVCNGQGPGRSELIISQCAHVLQRSVRYDRWLYIRTYHCGFHLFPKHQVFDLVADPHEQQDVAAAHPQVVREGSFRLGEWHDGQMARMPQDKVDPLWTVLAEGGPMHASHAGPRGHLPLPTYLQRLEATGRADGAAALRQRYAAYL